EDRPVSAIQQRDIGQARWSEVPFAATFVNVAKHHQLRANLLDAFQKVRTAGPTNPATLRHAVAIAQRRAQKDPENRCTRGEGPWPSQALRIAIKRPVKKDWLPGRSPDLESFPDDAGILQIGPGQVARDQIGRLLEDEIMIAGDADDLACGLSVQPIPELAVQ